MSHRSGFVNIIGSPNVGKSTLMNALIGEKLSITTSKAQTTRHLIHGMINGDDYQIVFSDTPGVVNSAYELHDHMMKFVQTALQDADVILFITDIFEQTMNHVPTLEIIQKMEVPVLLLINKIDLKDQAILEKQVAHWQEIIPRAEVFPISALHEFNLEPLVNRIKEVIPEGPAYYPKDELTDRNTRFFVAEIIREKIFENFDKEVPYSCEVKVEEYKEEINLTRIRAIIYVERESQKAILIGHKGAGLKKIGTQARKDIEKFIDQKVFLETYIKVDKDWRKDGKKLKSFGY
ncbi:MAG: GTP-binding protein Era [Patiriisocius sp.]|jgi:GTP-binding protein Era